MKRRRLIVNNDFDNIFHFEPPVSDQDVLDAVDKIAGTQVDTLFLDLPDVFVPVAEGTVSPEVMWAYRNYASVSTFISSKHLLEFHQAGKDPWRMILDRARQKGLELFASLRMNDTHYQNYIYSPFMNQFYYDNLSNRICAPTGGQEVGRKIGNEFGSKWGTEFDYRKSPVRDRMLGIIRRTIDKYDVDGLELNFARNCAFFPPENSEECAPVMTEFVRQVHGLLAEAAKKRGHQVLLCATVPCSLLKARKEGLDVPLWARMGLIDLLVMSTPFFPDFDRDIRDTIEKVPGVPVYAGWDRNFSHSGTRIIPVETQRALAMNYLWQGAAGVYFFNVTWSMNKDRIPKSFLDSWMSAFNHDACLMKELGDPATLAYLDKLYLMSYGRESADKPYASLPVTVPAQGEVTLRITIGDDIAKADREGRIEWIYVQTVSSDCSKYDNYTLKMNTVDLARQYDIDASAQKPETALLFPEPGRLAPLPPLENIRRHRVRHIDLHRGVNYLTIKSYGDPMTITDVELGIKYR